MVYVLSLTCFFCLLCLSHVAIVHSLWCSFEWMYHNLFSLWLRTFGCFYFLLFWRMLLWTIMLIHGGTAQQSNHFGKQICILFKLNIHLAYHPTILLLGIYTREIKTHVHTNTWKWIFMAAFVFIIMQNWK